MKWNWIFWRKPVVTPDVPPTPVIVPPPVPTRDAYMAEMKTLMENAAASTVNPTSTPLTQLELKKKVIEEQMAKFWEFCRLAETQYQEREQWEAESCGSAAYYENDGRVLADSIQEFSKTFLSSLTELVRSI